MPAFYARLSLQAAVLALALVTTGCVHHVHQHPTRVVTKAPPPWAPAHGHRHVHHDVTLVFDGELACYTVRGHRDAFFHHDHYYRWHGERWERARRLRGPWRVVTLDHLPSGLRGWHARRHASRLEREARARRAEIAAARRHHQHELVRLRSTQERARDRAARAERREREARERAALAREAERRAERERQRAEKRREREEKRLAEARRKAERAEARREREREERRAERRREREREERRAERRREREREERRAERRREREEQRLAEARRERHAKAVREKKHAEHPARRLAARKSKTASVEPEEQAKHDDERRRLAKRHGIRKEKHAARR